MFEKYKLKVGVPGDVGQVEAVRGAAGSRARLRVDANGVWTPQEAVLRLTAMERHGIFFFQAEDGIRDHCVTGVQTCALPIYRGRGTGVRGQARGGRGRRELG